MTEKNRPDPWGLRQCSIEGSMGGISCNYIPILEVVSERPSAVRLMGSPEGTILVVLEPRHIWTMCHYPFSQQLGFQSWKGQIRAQQTDLFGAISL